MNKLTKLTTEEANQMMMDFLTRNISAIEGLSIEDQDFCIERGGTKFLMMACPKLQ